MMQKHFRIAVLLVTLLLLGTQIGALGKTVSNHIAAISQLETSGIASPSGFSLYEKSNAQVQDKDVAYFMFNMENEAFRANIIYRLAIIAAVIASAVIAIKAINIS